MSGTLYVFSGPSGTGVRELVAALFASRADCAAVTPVTARKMKPGEKDGVGYYFYDLDGWKALQESGGLLESTVFAGNDYGTSRRLVREKLDAGKNVLLTLELARAAELKRNMPEAVCLYLEPEDPAELERRCRAASRSEFECRVRLETAARERALSGFCDRRIPTDDMDAALAALNALLDGRAGTI